MKKATHSKEQTRPRRANSIIFPENPTKIVRVLTHLLYGSSPHRFEAEGLGDHCLSPTFAVLLNHHCLVIQRQWEEVSNRWGRPRMVKHYSLPLSECGNARKVLTYQSPTRRADSMPSLPARFVGLPPECLMKTICPLPLDIDLLTLSVVFGLFNLKVLR